MVHTVPNATSATLEQTAVAVFSSLAEHPEHICSLSIRDLPYAKKGLSGGASRLYIQSALAQELLCPPLAELSQSMKPGLAGHEVRNASLGPDLLASDP